jgi:hypothetical protein
MEANEILALAPWPQHRGVLAAAIDYFRDDVRVPGLLLGGSFAAGSARAAVGMACRSTRGRFPPA